MQNFKSWLVQTHVTSHNSRPHHRCHDISNALACHSSIKHMTDSTATGIRRSESTLTNNLTFIFQALSHCCSNHADQDINGYVYSKWFLGFSASQLVLPFLNQSYILLACAAPNAKQVRSKNLLSTTDNL